jgi:hypothetical protein
LTVGKAKGNDGDHGDWEAQIYELVEQAERADGAEKVALLGEAVRLADLQQDVERATYLREELFEAAFDSGQYERALAEFNTMLAACDRHPDTFGADVMPRLLWLYKWVAEHAHKFPAVGKAQIEEMFRDMERRYAEAGLSMRAIYSLRSGAALDMGDAARAKRYYEKWIDAEEDGSEDCAACELNSLVEFLLRTGDSELALDRAKPLLQGRMSCAEVPGITQSFLLVPLLKLGRLELAAKSHRASYKQIRENRKFIGYAGNHLQYLALTNEATQAVTLLESRLAWALETRNGQDKFSFLLGARLLLARLAAQGRKTIKLLLPPSFPHVREDGRYDTAELAEVFLSMATDVAAQFDRRNGTDRYARLLQENEALIGFAPSRATE